MHTCKNLLIIFPFDVNGYYRGIAGWYEGNKI